MAMPGVWGKLNLKDHAEIVVLNAPDSFDAELRTLKGVKVRTSLSGRARVSFALAFVTRQQQVDSLAASLGKIAEGDAVVWFAYPKGTSKRYTSEIRRETGWKALGAQGFEGVRMIAIDDDWTAVRFRRAEYIKAMKRPSSYAMSARGKAKTAAN